MVSVTSVPRGDTDTRNRMRLAIFFGQAGVFPLYLLGLVAGLASGAAMLLHTVIKEVNPPQFGGTATGVITFLNFTFTPLLGPVLAVFFTTYPVAPSANWHITRRLFCRFCLVLRPPLFSLSC
jgi:MFS family permease